MPASRIRISLLRLILGRRLANDEYVERKISAFEGVPAMGLDGLGSSSYGPEAALTMLMPLGAAGLAYIGWVMLPILLLLVILHASYRQTIRAYPNNGDGRDLRGLRRSDEGLDIRPDARRRAALVGHPQAGDVIQGTGGLRRFRWKRPGTGKSGGVRVIYYWLCADWQIRLLTLYPKSRKDDLSAAEKAALKKVVEKWNG